ncbi:MAG: HIT family protein [Candidatus Saccharimonadales bacterium]
MEDSVFTKIIKGQIPCHKLYEDDQTIVFVPLHPVALGHVLAVPKRQVDQFFDLPQADYRALMATVKMMASHMKTVLGTKRVGLKVEGLDVPHAHVHILAFDTNEQFNQKPDESQPVDRAKLAALAAKLRLPEDNLTVENDHV